jgi:hypothetical protein
MQVIKYYQSENKAHWREEIGKGDWSAAELLHDWLESDKLKRMCGDATEVYLLTDGDKLVSFATLAKIDANAAVMADKRAKINHIITSFVLRGV